MGRPRSALDGAAHDLARFRRRPNALAAHYTHFRVSERLWLTGHSHQAWPDVALEGQTRAFLDAALHIDAKWEHAAQKAERVRAGYAERLAERGGAYALGSSTHELVSRWLSALPLLQRPRIVTTDAEFYSLRRQLDRLAEAGLEVVRVPAHPAGDVGGRLAEQVDSRTCAVATSLVFFSTGAIAGELGPLAERCARHGAELLIDAYHALNVLPVDLAALGLERAYVTGGGYKYMQLGEGNAFLRLPPDCTLRPLYTGWWADLAHLESPPTGGPVTYGEGASRFAGATYDPTSHYRAAAVLDFFLAQDLTPDLLSELNRAQRHLLAQRFDALDLDPRQIRRDPDVPIDRSTGFLSLIAPAAEPLAACLRARGVGCDARGERLRLGPAPYHSDAQLEDAIGALGEVVRATTAGAC